MTFNYLNSFRLLGYSFDTSMGGLTVSKQFLMVRYCDHQLKTKTISLKTNITHSRSAPHCRPNIFTDLGKIPTTLSFTIWTTGCGPFSHVTFRQLMWDFNYPPLINWKDNISKGLNDVLISTPKCFAGRCQSLRCPSVLHGVRKRRILPRSFLLQQPLYRYIC